MDEFEDIEKPKKAGSIKRITVENFMCHSNLTIEVGDRVNFITGQNGSGKSAILTALCVAFGIKAKGTQRANAVQDFIKNGCRSGLVVVELNNVGEDAFRPDVFGDTILVERRIVESGGSFCLKDSQGRKVGTKKDDVLEVVEHFNIEVENPCVVMTQDKSREFLHGGSDKEKFKFFFKATLLQHVSELLTEWEGKLSTAEVIVNDLFAELQPSKDELKQIEEQLKSLEQVEVLRAEIENLEKIYVWAFVKESEAELAGAENTLHDLANRNPVCQRKIDDAQMKLDLKRVAHAEKATFVARLIDDSQERQQTQNPLNLALTEATREKVQADADTNRVRKALQDAMGRLQNIEQDIFEMEQKMLQDTQAELDGKQEEVRALENRKEMAEEEYRRFQDEENQINLEVETLGKQRAAIIKEIDDYKSQLRDLANHIRGLQSQQTNMVTAFGGESVLRLLQAIEENHQRFTKPPLGPIGAHVRLHNGDWSTAVEVAVGRLLNDFVVTNQKDTLLLRDIGNRVGFRQLGIITASFDRPPIIPTANDLPDESLLTVLSALHSDIPTITNVLIDQGGVDQKVLVQDYNAGKNIAFNGGSRNVKEVIAMDGTRMYTRGGAETTLFKERRFRGGRLGVRVDEQIMQAQAQESEFKSGIQEAENRKRKLDQDFQRSRDRVENVKRRRREGERALRSHELALQDLRKSLSIQPESNKEFNMLELEHDAARTRDEVQSKEEAVQKAEIKLEVAKSNWAAAKLKNDQYLESLSGDTESLKIAEQELLTLEQQLQAAVGELSHWQRIMEERVVLPIQRQETNIEITKKQLEEHRNNAIQICSKEEREQLGEDTRTRDQLSNQMTRLNKRMERQEKETEPMEMLTKKQSKLRRKIASRERWFANLKEKLDTLRAALEGRTDRYIKNRKNLVKELTWGFIENLARKGFGGHISVDFDNKTLSLNVQMPQDASNTSVRDTRALSGGERSFTTLAFALAVHNMTESPFRAMDEFDVFMDAVSRKISLNTVVEFALQEGSQWIFITPHDISMVKGSRHVKKQQMPAPRP
ncbi:unnamed protein product [Calypogeia fissa]